MITATVRGQEAVVSRFQKMPPKLRAAIKVAITRLTLTLQRDVKSGKLSGQVLKVRTGTLRRSIDQRVIENAAGVVGRVSTNVRYGRVHEYGYTGPFSVKAHLRTIKQAFGRQIAAKSVMVGSHSRNVKLPERSFLRSALKDLDNSGKIERELQAAIRRAAS